MRVVRAKNKHDDKIQVFIQDPRFTKLDIEFFKSMDITVLDDPDAEAQVGHQTFVFSPCLEWEAEIPYLQAGKCSPLYVTSKAQWIYDAAETSKKTKESEGDVEGVQRCGAAIGAVTELLANHHGLRFDDVPHVVDYLPFSYHVLKDKEDVVEDLASEVASLQVRDTERPST